MTVTTPLGLHAYALMCHGHATAPLTHPLDTNEAWSTPVWSSLAWCLGPCTPTQLDLFADGEPQP